MFKTPLRYPGGKSRVCEYLVSLFPEFDEYREPFLGGGSVFLETLKNNPGKKYWINDLYFDLYCFWWCMSVFPEKVIEKVRILKNSSVSGKTLYGYCLKRLDQCRKEEDFYEVAACFFVLNRITFSGTSLSGGYSEESYLKRFTESSVDRLEEIGKDLNTNMQLKLSNEDFSSVINEKNPFYDEEDCCNSVFMFLDPPYYSAEDSALYGRNGDKHKGFDHERLKNCLDKCEWKWLMTYDDCPYIRELYKDYNMMGLEFSYGMRNAGGGTDMRGNELIISNYEIKKIESIELF